MTIMTDMTPPASRAASSVGAQPAPAPPLDRFVRLLEQSIEEQRDTRARLDGHIEISAIRFNALDKKLEGEHGNSRAQHLILTNDLADLRRHVGQIEEHVGFLTAKTAEHDTRFDRIDVRLDRIDARLDDLSDAIREIRNAVLPGAGEGSPTP